MTHPKTRHNEKVKSPNKSSRTKRYICPCCGRIYPASKKARATAEYVKAYYNEVCADCDVELMDEKDFCETDESFYM